MSKMLSSMIFGAIFCFITLSESFAQTSYKKSRSSFDLISRFGIPNDGKTKENFRNYFSIALRKEFSLGKFVSLNAATDYNSSGGKNSLPNLNTFNLGGGVTLYPLYLINLIFGKSYDDELAARDKFYFDEDILINLNQGYYGKAGDIGALRFEFNLNQYRLSKHFALSPKVGFIGNSFSPNVTQVLNHNPSFVYIGIAVDLGNFEKRR